MAARREVLAARGARFATLKSPLTEPLAIVEAERCLSCGGPDAPAPCLLACPAEVDVPAFVGAIAKGDPVSAAATIFAENLLGGSCTRVCPTEELCEGACVLGDAGHGPLEIARLERFATDQALSRGLKFRSPSSPNGMRVAVIGAGPEIGRAHV